MQSPDPSPSNDLVYHDVRTTWGMNLHRDLSFQRNAPKKFFHAKNAFSIATKNPFIPNEPIRIWFVLDSARARNI